MVQMRWYKTHSSEKLQYRVKHNATVYAGTPTVKEKLMTANYQWSEWMDVPKVWDVDAEEIK